tara:strand:- start:311 stop:1012 length:702 start_codon:yes stop_codon:yes gene_type:complete
MYLLTVPDSWNKIFINYESKDKKIDTILNKLDELEKTYNDCSLNIQIFPKKEHIFKCFNYFESIKTKVVILGQDPYHGQNQAIGLCFGISKDCKVPPSLKNIAKELKEDLNIQLQDFSLENWAKQGILMLNASLSVIQGKPNSQANLWTEFTKFIIYELNKNTEPIIFVAWGAFAHNQLKNVNVDKHHLIVSSHPSPLSVYKKYKEFPAFMGSKPFSKINMILEKNKTRRIEW